MESKKPPTTDPDEVEDEVLNTLPTLNASELEEICELIGVTVKETQKGKRRVLVKLVMKFLCVDEDEDDEKLAEFLLVYSTTIYRRRKKRTRKLKMIRSRRTLPQGNP